MCHDWFRTGYFGLNLRLIIEIFGRICWKSEFIIVRSRCWEITQLCSDVIRTTKIPVVFAWFSAKKPLQKMGILMLVVRRLQTGVRLELRAILFVRVTLELKRKRRLGIISNFVLLSIRTVHIFRKLHFAESEYFHNRWNWLRTHTAKVGAFAALFNGLKVYQPLFLF